MLALHNECLTCRYLLGRLDFLLGLLGFSPGVFHALKGIRKLRLFRLEVTLQGLELLAELLELLLYVAHPRSCFSRSIRSVAALSSASDSAFFRAATSVVAPIKNHDAFC